MKVCYISAEGYGLFDEKYTAVKNYSGSEIGIHTDAIELAKDSDFDVHILLEYEKEITLKRNNTKVWTMDGSFKDKKPLSFIKYRMNFWNKIKEINADIYVQRAAPGEIYFLTSMFCKLYGKKYVQVLGVTTKKNVRITEIGRFIRWNVFGSAALRLADAIIAISRDQLPELSKNNQRKTHVLYTGKYLCDKIAGRQQRKYILWVGSSRPEKRQELFIKLAERIPDNKFVMIRGNVSKLPKNLQLISAVPHKDIDKYYSKAIATVSTSALDWNSHAYLESWNNGTPVVALTIDSDESICKYKTGFHSRTFEQLVKDVKKILNDNKLWKRLSKNSVEYAEKNHDVRKQIEKYKELFRKINSE
jgi:glycosyltransferase involved in cell wall biosynthesis